MSEDIKEPEAVFEMPSDTAAVDAACTAYRLADEIDGKLLSKKVEKMIDKIKEDAIFIISRALTFIREPYEEDKPKD